jgi:hypothetical protein
MSKYARTKIAGINNSKRQSECVRRKRTKEAKRNDSDNRKTVLQTDMEPLTSS